MPPGSGPDLLGNGPEAASAKLEVLGRSLAKVDLIPFVILLFSKLLDVYLLDTMSLKEPS